MMRRACYWLGLWITALGVWLVMRCDVQGIGEADDDWTKPGGSI